MLPLLRYNEYKGIFIFIIMVQNIGVIGVGRLGLCMALCFEKVGYNVICFDKDDSILDAIRAKTISSFEPHVTDMLSKSNNLYVATCVKHVLQESDIVFIVVPTPSLPDNSYDHSCVDDVISQLENVGSQQNHKTIVISCTVMPEYCQRVGERLRRLNMGLCYNPEFIAQGDIVRGFEIPDMVLIGAECSADADVVASVYKRMCPNNPAFCFMGLTEAEICKISLNCFITMKIAFANMIGDLVRRSGGNAQTVLDAISQDSRIGRKCMTWGFGYGGPCLPRDNLALQHYARTKNIDMLLSMAADSANDYHLNVMVDEITHEERGAIEFPYATYKPESVIIDSSFPLRVAEKLARLGEHVVICERAHVINMLEKKYGDLFTYKTT